MRVHRGHSWGQIRTEHGFLWELIVCFSHCCSNTRMCLVQQLVGQISQQESAE